MFFTLFSFHLLFMEKENQAFFYLRDYVFHYLKKIDPQHEYVCKDSEHSFLFIRKQSYLLCMNKDFADSIYFAEVQIDWNETMWFPSVKKDSFKKLNIEELRDYISHNVGSLTEIKDLLKLNKPKDSDD
jgi:hypothetical protein